MCIVISAPSGTGKTTLINSLLENVDNIDFSVSTTTRTKRSSEESLKAYNFVTVDEFKDMIDQEDFLEWAIVHGNYYGTTKKEIDRIAKVGNIPLFDVDVQGGRNLRHSLDSGVFIFVIPPSIDVLEKRLKNRKTETEDEIKLRLENAVREIKEYETYDYIIINDDLSNSVDLLISIIKAESCRKDRVKHIINNMEGLDDYTIG